MRRTVRTLLRTPWHSVAVTGTMALAITLAVTVFAIVDGVLFRPLPYERPRELFLVEHVRAETGPEPKPLASIRDLETWRLAAPEASFAYLANSPGMPLLLAGGYSFQWGVDPQLLAVLGVNPLLGGLTQADVEEYDLAQPGETDQRRPVLITYTLWQRLFAGDPSVIGDVETVARAGPVWQGFRVAGVLREDFVFPTDEGSEAPERLFPLTEGMFASPASRERMSIRVLVRLPAGRKAEAVARRLTDATRRDAPGDTVRLVPLSDYLGSRDRGELARLTMAVAGLFLLALVNVVGLMTARAATTARDIAVRRALGANRRSLAWHVLGQVAPLVGSSVLVALVASPWLLVQTLGLLPSEMMLLHAPQIDARAMVVVTLAAILATLVVTWWVTRTSARISPWTLLIGATWSTSLGRRRTSRIFVGVQIALGSVLLVLASLFATSLGVAWTADSGYSSRHNLVVEAGVIDIADLDDWVAQTSALVDVLRAIPGVTNVAESNAGFISGLNFDGMPSGYVPSRWSDRDEVIKLVQVSNAYFEVVGLALRAGRWPTESEWLGRRVAMVSESAARRFWSGESAIGQVLVGVRPHVRGHEPPPLTVVGVVADSRYRSLDRDPTGEVYAPLNSMDPTPPSQFFAAITEAAGRVRPQIEAALAADSRFRLSRIRTIEEALASSIRPRALRAWLFGWLGAAALVVLGTGVLSLVATSTAARTREVGIRMAMGAAPMQVLRLFVGEQAAPVLFGLGAGALMAALIVPYLRTELYGIGPYDPRVWFVAVATTAGAAVIASWGPSLRAARLEPSETLRTD